MVKRKAKKAVKKAPAVPECNMEGNDKKDDRIEENKAGFMEQEVERQCAAIRATRDVEIQHMLTALRLLRSYCSEEQLQTPVLQFFNENFPNLSLVRNAENGQFEVQWKLEEGKTSVLNADGSDMHASLLNCMSLARSQCLGIPSTEAGGTSLLLGDNLHIKDFVLEGTSDSQIFGMKHALQTPGVVTSQRLSIGMTPKTLRLPKPGEMLLSVHGSPLGVYKEDNMEAIYESEDD